MGVRKTFSQPDAFGDAFLGLEQATNLFLIRMYDAESADVVLPEKITMLADMVLPLFKY